MFITVAIERVTARITHLQPRLVVKLKAIFTEDLKLCSAVAVKRKESKKTGKF